jgi:hypothetical protein
MDTLGCSGPVWRALHLERRRSGESLAPTLGLVPMMVAATGVVFLLGGIIVDLSFSSDVYGLGSPGENPSFG